MKTKIIYHLDTNCNLVKIEKRTTLLGVVIRRKEIKSTLNLSLNAHSQMISNHTKQTKPLEDCTENQADLIARHFSRIRYGNSSVEGWITRPYSKGDEKAPKKQA